MASPEQERLGLIWGSVTFWGRTASNAASELLTMSASMSEASRVVTDTPLPSIEGSFERSVSLRFWVGTYCTAVYNVERISKKVLGPQHELLLALGDAPMRAKDVRDVFVHPEDYSFGTGHLPVAPGLEGVRSLLRLRNGTTLEVGITDRMVAVTELAQPLHRLVKAVATEINVRTASISEVSPRPET